MLYLSGLKNLKCALMDLAHSKVEKISSEISRMRAEWVRYRGWVTGSLAYLLGAYAV